MRYEEKNYIADIEQYFLGLAGTGLMLSARDYGFIRELGDRSIPREMVIKAIAYGFETRRQRGVEEPRGLFNIKQEVEEYLKDRLTERESKCAEQQNTDFTRNSTIEESVKKLDRIIIEEQREDIKKKYKRLRQRVRETENLNSSTNVYKQLNFLWRDFVEDLFLGLSTDKQKDVTAVAESRLPSEAKFYDKDTKEKTFKAFRDEIVCETLGIKNVFTMK